MIFYPLLLFSPAGNHRFLLNCSHNKLFIKYSVIVISKTTWGLHRVGINSFSSCIFKITLTTSFITVCLLQPGANLDLLLAQEIQGLSWTLEESCEYKKQGGSMDQGILSFAGGVWMMMRIVSRRSYSWSTLRTQGNTWP